MRRRKPLHARSRPPVRTRSSVLLGVVVAPLLLVLWMAGTGTADAAFAATTTVRPGDTLSAIATRYHTTVAALVAANGITNPNQIYAGDSIVVPGPPATAPSPPPAPPVVVPSAITVVVRNGDTLSAIATRYHTTVAALVSTNRISNPNLVFAGAHLSLPGPSLPPGWGPGGPLPTTLLAHPDRLSLRPAFLSAASASGVAPSLLEALCWWESGWQSGATSPTGAIGLCQLEPSTVTYARTTLLHNPNLDPRAPSDNIAMAAAYIQNLTTRDGGNVRTAIAAYYQGLSSVQSRGMLGSTQNYVTGIFAYAAIFAQAG
ncbi:MAG TPA: LysM peptidoglycan-binding domain-containing protein [Acidimicrobiales bacterium]